MLTTQALPYDIRRTLFSIVKKTEFVNLQKRRMEQNTEYSLKPFDDTKSIFIHIPKAAGISICKSIYGGLVGGHTPISRYQYVFSKKDFYSYFKYTFVRNPWDRLFSAYSFLKKGGFNKDDEEWAILNLSKYMSFEQFVMEGMSEENVMKYIHFIPQTQLLFFPGTSILPIDYLGFYENIEDDFKYISKKINKNTSLLHLNKTEKKNTRYLKEYNPSMIDIVQNIYHVDIETFGYSFDNSTLHKQLSRRIIQSA